MAAVLMMPAAATAQGNPGPFGGLFGRSPAVAGTDHTTVSIRSTVGGQYDTRLLAREDSVEDDSTQSGTVGSAAVGIEFDHTTARFTSIVRGNVDHQEYFTEPTYGVNVFGADALVQGKIASWLQADAAATYVHSPFFQVVQGFGQSTALTAAEQPLQTFSPFAVRALENEMVEASASVSSRFTKRQTVGGSVHRRQTRFTQGSAQDFVLNGYRALWNLQLSRGLGVHAGYGVEQADQFGAPGTDYEHEVIDVGVDFNRELSLARRTTLGFSTSTSFIKDDASSDRQFRLNGAISLSKHFRRTWRAMVNASRETSFVPGFVEPIFSDMVGASLSGMFARRLNWMAAASGGRGRYGFSDTGDFSTASATSRLTVALGRQLGLFGQYVLYRYDFPPNATTLALPGRFTRQAVSVGVTAYVPVYENTRKRRDSR